MTKHRFDLTGISSTSGQVLRLDTASGSDTPATIYNIDGLQMQGSSLPPDHVNGGYGVILGPDGVSTLYAKHMGGIAGTTVIDTTTVNALADAPAVDDANVGKAQKHADPITLKNGLTLSDCVGAPTGGGNVGDIRIRKDGGVGTTVYRCTTAGVAGVAVWTAIL